MARVVKAAAVRRAEILTHAVNLFFSKGYDATTVDDILESVGISKGAFYHHFESKEELLEAFTEAIAKSIATHASFLLAEDCGECARLNRFLELGRRIQHESEPAPVSAYASLFRTGNEPLYQRILGVGARTLRPILSTILASGVAKGEFDVADEALAVETILNLSTTRFPVLVEALRLSDAGDVRGGQRVLSRRLTAECRLIERILGLPSNSIVLADAGRVVSALTALSSKSAPRRTRKRGAAA
jgi:AcrR family transcriptional regulator